MEQIFKYLGNKEQLWVAILAVFAVGFGKILEKYLRRDSEDLNETLEIRKALREEVNALHEHETTLHEQIKSAQHEADEWREKYWELMGENAKHQVTILGLREELADTKLELHEYKEINLRLSSPNYKQLSGGPQLPEEHNE